MPDGRRREEGALGEDRAELLKWEEDAEEEGGAGNLGYDTGARIELTIQSSPGKKISEHLPKT